MKYIVNNIEINNFTKKRYYTNNRFIILFSIIITSITIIFFKITILQLFNTKQLIQKSDLISSRIQLEPNSRGIIKDRSGNILALSIPVNNISIDPKFFLKKKLL
ncbi:hypothetical protein [Buchnera aphidicola]|uniref:hypothetical protein n=1 Tax=Buchnera aphidicola TaxID=9 RepID=UPI0021C636F0